MKICLNFVALLMVSSIMISCGGKETSSSQTAYTLKWKGIDWMENGPSYQFEDQDGKEFHFSLLIIPEFKPDSNSYFTIRYDRSLPEYQLKDEIKDKWFRVNIEKQLRSIEGSGKEGEVEVIVDIEPVE